MYWDEEGTAIHFLPESIMLNMNEIHKKLCKNWHFKNFNKKFLPKNSLTLTLGIYTRMGMVLRKILDQYLPSYQT